MTVISQDFQRTSQPQSSAKGKTPRYKTTRDCPRVTLRLSVEDHERLKALADGMALSTFIRAKALGDTMPRRTPRSTTSIADKAALAQIFGLLGQSRIANNLNQLAYHANIGALPIDDVTLGQISEAYDNVLEMRTALIAALGLKP
ncbi:plasmid mobilization protein [Octadecabacter ascidiaceicola]|uniref:Bacterial mobilisation domain-containing protein n=1 Tax=Octadecabacter ascidiaceicola TaxID=1655543 RepID=A0A238KR91_9RHOB|nr:hypothetical protein [Octadecabacter ascidiaceicola]SMX44556.1 hypothetical protein OCA8868_03172 [Octadecabacter ascidiaceicola]